MSSNKAQNLTPGVQYHGFRLLRLTPVPEVRSVAYQFEHVSSGARLLHLSAPDSENLFSVSFPTPALDNTGISHILEHCVLAGSQRFPVREPFFEMIKMSMATFINAMTAEDSTYYPVCSNVPKDLFNLAEVYLDATLKPLLEAQTFRREGHHLAPGLNLTNESQPSLSISGVVYNEMKGVFSNPEARLGRLLNRGLLPDTIYANESGGDPEAIPNLTYKSFLNYHSNYYHPSNSYFFSYGDIPTTQYCEFLDNTLNSFCRQTISWPSGTGMDCFAPTRQRRWNSPRFISDSYPIGNSEPERDRTYLVTAWLTGDAIDPEDVVLMRILSLILAGNEGAPLPTTMAKSKIGADLIYSGSSSVGPEATFVIGLRGSEADRVGSFNDLIDSKLSDLATSGIQTEMIETAIRQVAFEYLEIQPMFPLHTLFRVMGSWIYGQDPLNFLSLGVHLEKCRKRWVAEPDLFARLIRQRLLDNPHRLNIVMSPSKGLQAQIDSKTDNRVQQIITKLSEEQIAKITAEAEELEQYNSVANTADELNSLPQLTVNDLPVALQHIPTERTMIGDITLLRNDLFTNGVNYLLLDFDLKGLPEKLWQYLPYYLDAIAKLGVTGSGYEEIARRKAASSGGIRGSFALGSHCVMARRTLSGVRFSLKALDGQIEEALSILGSLFFSLDPHDHTRLRELLVQSHVGYQTGLIQAGAQTASLHAGRYLSKIGYLSELVHGLPQLSLSKKLVSSFDQEYENLTACIEEIRDFILVRTRLTVSHTGSQKGADHVIAALSHWNTRLKDSSVGNDAITFKLDTSKRWEGLAAEMNVAYCAQTMPALHFSQSESVALEVGSHIVNLDWILPEVRFKGHAYGAWFRYDSLEGSITLGSYRDPHIARTLDVFSNSEQFVSQSSWSQRDIDRAIIAVAKKDFKPLRPLPATGLALQRYLSGITSEIREARHERLKAITAEKVKQYLCQALNLGLCQSSICVVSSRKKLEQANRDMNQHQLSIEDILTDYT